MAGPWLYVLARAANREFWLDDERRLPVTFENFRLLVESGKIRQDRWWDIKQNWKKVELGDELYVYVGDGDIGIVGFAVVDDLQQLDDLWCIRPNFDLKKCQQLLENPVPAAVVRSWVPFPRRNVIDLGQFQSELYSLLPWKASQRRVAGPKSSTRVAGSRRG